MAHIEIENLTFSYPSAGRPSLSNVSLTIRRGEYVVLCGKSGSGKTTLLRHLKSVLAPHGKRSGDIRINGVSLKDMSQRDQAAKVGFVMQNPDDQIVTDKVWHELAFGLESLGCDQKTMRARVAEMACYFGIQDWFHRDVANLSGGQKQLLNLASIMAMQPEILILDEPTNHLDMDSREVLEDALENFPGTILAISHDRYFINRFATKVCVLEAGGVKEYLGNYDDYFEKINRQQAPDSENAGMTKTAMDKEKRKSREEEKRIREKKNAIAAAEKAIATAEEEAAEMEAQLADPATYQDAEKAAQLAKAYQLKKDEIERRYAEWEALSAEE